LNVVKFGYRLEFEDLPERVFLKNNKSSLENLDFVENIILELLEKDALKLLLCKSVDRVYSSQQKSQD
jgi:hypothetical protein